MNRNFILAIVSFLFVVTAWASPSDTEAQAPCLTGNCESASPFRQLSQAANQIHQFTNCQKVDSGVASFYGKNDGTAGRKTASGEVFNPSALTAAHRTLPFGTKVTVRDLNSGREVVVRITDRGPFVRKRIIDLSYQAAKIIGIDKTRPTEVELTVCK